MKYFLPLFTGLAIAAAVLIHFFGGQLGVIGLFSDRQSPGLFRDQSWYAAASDPSRYDAYSAYNILQRRGTDIAIPLALEDIHSDDPYLWLNAATYLGSHDRKEAIPYLIKSIRHTAWRSVDERVLTLSSLTGVDFGTNFDDWKSWYDSNFPTETIDWNSALGHSPRFAEGS